MENLNGVKNMDISQLTDTELSRLYLIANSFYGDIRKYNMSEYMGLYQKIVKEKQKRAKDKFGKNKLTIKNCK